MVWTFNKWKNTTGFLRRTSNKLFEINLRLGGHMRNLEQKLAKYKSRMELIRTMIGVIVLGIQIVILINLLSK